MMMMDYSVSVVKNSKIWMFCFFFSLLIGFSSESDRVMLSICLWSGTWLFIFLLKLCVWTSFILTCFFYDLLYLYEHLKHSGIFHTRLLQVIVTTFLVTLFRDIVTLFWKIVTHFRDLVTLLCDKRQNAFGFRLTTSLRLSAVYKGILCLYQTNRGSG